MALINGKVYDWNSVTINVSGMENIELQEISYDDEQEVDPVYGKGGKIRGYGTGNQKNSVKLSMLREDFNEMTRVIKSKGYKNFYKYMVPKITVLDNICEEQNAELKDTLEEYPAMGISLGEKLLNMLGLSKDTRVKKL